MRRHIRVCNRQVLAGSALQSGFFLLSTYVMFGLMHVQVRQEDLTRMDIRKREAMNATRTAFGADYEANLRKEAGPNPEKVARRKHQISSLYHQAKMKVRYFDTYLAYPSLLWPDPQSCACSADTVQ